MSLFDYQASRVIAAEDYPFYALVMAAMRQADTHNTRVLAAAFPEVAEELAQRYNAPGGILPTERCPDCGHAWTEHDADDPAIEVPGCNHLNEDDGTGFFPPCECMRTRP